MTTLCDTDAGWLPETGQLEKTNSIVDLQVRSKVPVQSKSGIYQVSRLRSRTPIPLSSSLTGHVPPVVCLQVDYWSLNWSSDHQWYCHCNKQWPYLILSLQKAVTTNFPITPIPLSSVLTRHAPPGVCLQVDYWSLNWSSDHLWDCNCNKQWAYLILSLQKAVTTNKPITPIPLSSALTGHKPPGFCFWVDYWYCHCNEQWPQIYP